LPKRWRLWCWLATSGAVACVIATGGRSAILFAGVILMAAIAWRFVGSRRGPALLIMVAATVVVAVVVLLWLPVDDSVVWKKLVLEYRLYSAQGRTDVYVESIGRLLERPLLGWGTQELASQAGWTYLRLGTHSELLNVTYRFGLLGLMGYLAIGVTFAIWCVQRISHLRRAAGESRRVNPMVLMGIGVGAMALNSLMHVVQWDVNVYWISLGLVGLVHALGTGPGPLAGDALRSAGS
ncbi:MAG: O-antigen ligase family protein, partial [Thermoanaerobaculia bacterium]